jgi:hypothetical protein
MLKMRLVATLATLLVAPALLSACGDGTGPDTDVPNVAGLYNLTGRIEAATCTPRQPPPGGTVIFNAFNFEDSGTPALRITQDGSRLTVRFPNAPPETPPYTGTVDRNGNVDFGAVDDFTEEPREGNRIFRVELTGSFTLRREDGGKHLRGTASFVNVFREGQDTAVFATCSRGATAVLTRQGA